MLHDMSLDVSSNTIFFISEAYETFADGIEMMFVGIGLIAVPVAVFTYKRINANRDAAMSDAGEKGAAKLSSDELRRLGDRAPDFRYTI
jgi:hypothetical protein